MVRENLRRKHGHLSKKTISNYSCFLFTVVFALLTLSSCGNQVIRRDRQGTRIGSGGPHPEQITFVKKRIALLPLFNESPYGGEDLALNATEELRRELSRSGEFIVDAEGEKIFGSSKEIYAGGGIKLTQLSRKAKLSGINFVLFGRVQLARIRQKNDEIGFIRKTKSFADANVEIRIYDVSSRKEVYTRTLEAHVDDSTFRFYMSNPEEKLSYRQRLLRYAVRVAVRRSIPQIVEISRKMDWTGRVAKIIGQKIYVNAGRKAGIHIGDILKVMTEGTDIYDPETGAHLGVSQGEVKGTLEIIDYFGPDGAIAILHSGGSVQEGDFVQLY